MKKIWLIPKLTCEMTFGKIGAICRVFQLLYWSKPATCITGISQVSLPPPWMWSKPFGHCVYVRCSMAYFGGWLAVRYSEEGEKSHFFFSLLKTWRYLTDRKSKAMRHESKKGHFCCCENASNWSFLCIGISKMKSFFSPWNRKLIFFSSMSRLTRISFYCKKKHTMQSFQVGKIFMCHCLIALGILMQKQ